MKAQLLKVISPMEKRPLELVELPTPQPGAGEILVRVLACGVCHTELDEIEGRLPPRLPVILGHEIVGRVAASGTGAHSFRTGDRIGIAWIYHSCGECDFCRRGLENLCPDFLGTGCDANGGYAEYVTVSEDYAYPIPERFTDTQAAPLLCAGAIGLRDLRLAGIQPGQTLGLFGFGASAHIVIQVARHWGCPVFAFSRSPEHRALAKSLGAAWAGAVEDDPPEMLDNITRRDARDFLALAAEIPILPEVEEFPLEAANDALIRLKEGLVKGAAVLRMS